MITDRTQIDVDSANNIRETRIKNFDFLTTPLTQSEINTLERGVLTVATINRIENKQSELKGLLNNAGYWNTPVIKKQWTGDDWHYLEDWQRILNNDNLLKNAFYIYTDTPRTPSTRLDYINVNAVEKILVDLETMINAMKAEYRYCGTFNCGE